MSIDIAFVLFLGLVAVVALAALVLELNHVIRGDGLGHRPAPRSLSEDSEGRAVALSRLTR